MLTKSKVLSNTGVEIGGSKLSSIVNNNINIVTEKTNPYENIEKEVIDKQTNVEQNTKQNDTQSTETTTVDQVVKYKSHEEVVIDFLKKIIMLYSTNTLKIDGKLVLHNDELVDLISLIIMSNYPELNEVVVNIKVDYEVNCCGSSKGLNIISKILVNSTHDMKYVYNEEYNSLMQYGISLKYTLD